MKYINENLILLNLKVKNKWDLINIFIKNLYDDSRIINKELILEDIIRREELSSTYIGNGISLVHTMNKEVIFSSVGIAKLSNSIQWDSEGNFSDLIIIICLNVDNQNDKYAFKDFVRSLVDSNFIRELRETNNKEEIKALVEGKLL